MVEYPEQGEIVISKITKVLDYGVFVELLEYEGVQGFVHISNVSSTWIKNIRNFVKEGQIRAGKVIAVDLRKNQIDISLTKVSQSQQREKIEGYRQAKRAQKLVELARARLVTPEVAWAEVAEPLLEKYDSLNEAFNEVLVKPDTVLALVPKKWAAPLKEIVEKNFELPEKTVRGKVEISIPGQNGVDALKKALLAGVKKGGKHVQVAYDGSGKYSVWSTAPDYKAAEKLLKAVCDEISASAIAAGGKVEVEKVEA